MSTPPATRAGRGPRRTGRITSAIAVTGAATLILAACGTGEETAGGDGDGGDGGGGGGGTISIWDYYGPEDSATGGPLVDLLERYEDENPDVTIERRYIPYEDFNRTLLQSAAAGDLPDIALLNAFDTGTMAEAGVIADIGDRVEEWGGADGFFPTSWETAQFDGVTYGLPHVADAYALFYNADLLAAANLTPPTTWSELGTTATALSADGRFGLATAAIDGVEGATSFIIRLLAAGGDVTEIDSDAGRAAMTQFSELVDGGAMSPGVLTWNEEDVMNQFANGQAAMMINSASYVSVLREDFPDLSWNVALLPGDQTEATFLSAENLTITTASDDPDAAFELMTWMQDPAVLAEYLPARNKLPARPEVAEEEGFADDEIRQVFLDQLQSAWAPEGDVAAKSNEIFTHIQEAVQVTLSGSAGLDDALGQAQAKIDETLAD